MYEFPGADPRPAQPEAVMRGSGNARHTQPEWLPAAGTRGRQRGVPLSHRDIIGWRGLKCGT